MYTLSMHMVGIPATPSTLLPQELRFVFPKHMYNVYPSISRFGYVYIVYICVYIFFTYIYMETWYVIHRIKSHQQNAHVCMSSRQQGRDRLVLVCSSRVYRESIQSSGTICLLAFDDVDLRWLFTYGCFQKLWYPQIINFNKVVHHKPSILGYPYFWKHPYIYIYTRWWCQSCLSKLTNVFHMGWNHQLV